MSTKIYHGYRLAEDADVWEFTERLRREGNEERDRLDMEAIGRLSEAAMQKRLDEGKELPQSPEARLMAGYHAWTEIERTLGESRLSDPHQLDVVFIRDPGGGRLLALLYAGSKMEAVFTRQPEVEPWGYWDNTDWPDDMTEEEWREREETWERCMPEGRPSAVYGLSFQLRTSMSDGIIEMIYRDPRQEE